MKLTRGKKAAMVCFAVFLAFMAVCTVVAKGIYASGLPRVTTAKPYSGSLTHVIKVNGMVVQGQEYGVYVEPGLRVATLSVDSGGAFQTGDPLFRIEPGDLAGIIAQRRLEISKLEVQMAETIGADGRDRQSRKRAAERAREDYDREVVMSDVKIRECQQAYEAAQKALALYNQYLEDSSRLVDSGEDNGTLSDGNGDGNGIGAGNEVEPGAGGDSNGNGDVLEGSEAGGSNGHAGSGGGEADISGGEEAGAGSKTQPDGSEEKTGIDGNEEKISADGRGENPGTDGNKEKPDVDGSGEEPDVDGNGERTSAEGRGERTSAIVSQEKSSVDRSGEGTAGAGVVGSLSHSGGNSREICIDRDGETENTLESYKARVSDGSRKDNGGLHEVSSVVVDSEQQYNKQEKLLQLEQNVITAAQALEEAERQKEDRLKEAARALEDAEAAIETENAAVNTMALDIAYQKERLQSLEELLEADGWVYAEVSGRVTDNRLEVGERTQDGAGITYALDDGERIISTVFSEEQAKHVAVGTQFEMKATMPDGSRVSGNALLDYLEKGTDGMVRARFSFELPDMSIGQSAELTYRMQTDAFSTCVSGNCIYQEGEDRYYVYTVEEQAGILGTEWKLRKVNVQILDRNDTVMAVQSVEITNDTRIVSGTNKTLADGDTVRVVQ